MKKLLVLLVILILCIQLISCNRNRLPLTSDNFSKDFINSFSDNYRLVDPQLAYVTASPWEVEIKAKDDQDTDRLYLSLIDNVDKARFISVTERYDYYMGAPSYSVLVYQTPDSPTPMKDWTIKSIKILETTPFADSEENVLLLSEKYMETLIASSAVLRTYDNDNGSDFLDMMKNAYSTAEKFERYQSPATRVTRSSGQPSDLNYLIKNYSLLIEFNECDNIIWHSYLCEDSENLYFECTAYGVEDVERKGFSIAKINDEYKAEIHSLIEALS